MVGFDLGQVLGLVTEEALARGPVLGHAIQGCVEFPPLLAKALQTRSLREVKNGTINATTHDGCSTK